jgi:hypothetical protein
MTSQTGIGTTSSKYRTLVCPQCGKEKNLNAYNFSRIENMPGHFCGFCKPCMKKIKSKLVEIEEFNRNNSPLFNQQNG